MKALVRVYRWFAVRLGVADDSPRETAFDRGVRAGFKAGWDKGFAAGADESR